MHTKTIENQLFGDYFKDRKIYKKKIRQYCTLLNALVWYPTISKKLQSKNFETSKMENCIKKLK